MDAKFFDSLYEGDSAHGVKLAMGITGGDFWPRPAGCFTIYRGQDGNMDYDAIQAVAGLDDGQVSIANQYLPANTVWVYRRRQVSDCGRESDPSDACAVVIDSNGDMIGNTPNAPVLTTVEQLAGARLRVSWRYTPLAQEIEPTGFNIYMDSGSGFDFNNPTATVPYSSRGHFAGEFNWTSGVLVNGQVYCFIVRSYRTGAGESQNDSYVFAVADSEGPAAITGLRASWDEV